MWTCEDVKIKNAEINGDYFGKIVWTPEVERIASLCQKYHVILLSDEIHGDLVE